MKNEFVPKKTVTIQVTMEVFEKFCEVCRKLDLPKTKAMEKMILEEYDAVFTEKCVR